MTSLRVRVGLAAALVLAIFLVLTALALEKAFQNSAESAMRQRLFAQLYLVMAATELDADGRPALPEQLGEPRFNLPGSGLYARISDASGQPLWQSPSSIGLSLALAPGAPGQEAFRRQRLGGRTYFVASLGVEWETGDGLRPLLFSVVEDTAALERELERYRTSLWSWLGGMAVLLLLAQVAALAWGLRPLATVRRELAAIERGEQEGLRRRYPRELQGLTDGINALLHHERAQQTRYKDALADLAHSLKTPLAILRGLGTVASREQAGELEAQVARMDDIVQYQLQRAATSGRSVLAGPLPVRPVLNRILASLAKVYQARAVMVRVEESEGASFRGDEGDLMELLGNLLDNAYKWCRNEIRVEARCEGRRLHLRVDDDGPGMDESQVGEILRRGVRLDQATPGHGIGLAMVRDIVDAYEGRLHIGRSPLGGASIRLHLPGCG